MELLSGHSMESQKDKQDSEWESLVERHKEDLDLIGGPLVLANMFAQAMANARGAALSPRVPAVAEEWAEGVFTQFFHQVGEIAKESGIRNKLLDRGLYDPRLDSSPEWNDGLTLEELDPIDRDDDLLEFDEEEEIIEDTFGPLSPIGLIHSYGMDRRSKDPLPGQYNRLFPVKIVLRVAANLIKNRDERRKLGDDDTYVYEELNLGDLREECLKVASYAKARFEWLDSRSQTDFGERLSVGLPDFSGDKSKKQKERFVSQFVGSVRNKGKGLPFELGLLSTNSEGDVEFTDWGVHFMILENPIIDKVDIGSWKSGDAFSTDEKAFLIRLIEKFNPVEYEYIQKVVKWINDGNNRPKSLDASISEELGTNATESSLIRSGLTARMLELGIINRTKEGREVTFSLSKIYEDE